MNEILSLLVAGVAGFIPVVIIFVCREINQRRRSERGVSDGENADRP